MSDNRERMLRRKLQKQGYALCKSKAQDINNLGGYMIIDAFRNVIEAGERYDLSLDDVERFINE